MTSTEHLDEDELALLALEPARATDALRSHAASCAACAGSVRDAEATFAALGSDSADTALALALGERAHTRAVAEEASRRRRIGGALVATLAAAALLVVGRLLGVEAPFASPSHGALACAMTECVGAAIGLGVVALRARHGLVPLDPLGGAAVAAGSAVITQAYVQLRCPEHEIVHLVLAHAGTVLLVALAGAVAGPRLSRPSHA